jgi:hypothetical protein
MTLWHVLMMTNMVMPISGGVAGLSDLQTGWFGYCVAIAIGIVLGSISVWMLWTLGRRVLRSTTADDRRTIWRLRLLYWFAGLWPFVTLLGSGSLMEGVLKTFPVGPS